MLCDEIMAEFHVIMKKLHRKLKDDLQKLGLPKPMTTRRGLEQLAITPYVVLTRLSISDCHGKLQSSQSSNQNSVPFHKKQSESEYQNIAEKKQRAENSHDIPQRSDVQISSVAAGIASIGAIDASETYQSKIQEYNLSRTDSSNDTIQDFTSKPTKKNSQIDVTSTNRRYISAKRTDIQAASNSASKNESLKKHTQNFVHKSADKSSCPKNKTVFPKDKSTCTSTKKANISVSQTYFSSRNKSLNTAMSIPLLKCHSDSRRSVEPLKDDDVFAEHKEKKKNKIEIKQELSSVKTKLIETLEECSNKSKNDVFPESNASSSRNIIISQSKICSEAKVDSLIDENQVTSILEEHMQTHVNLESVEHIDSSLCQTPIEKVVNQTKINLESKNPQIDSPIEINSKTIIKRKLSSESLDQNILLIKVRKKNQINTSPNKAMTNNNIEIVDYEMLSDDELVHTKQKYRKNVVKNNTIRKKESYELLERKRGQHRKECKKKIKNIRKKLHEYFRGSFEPNTSESEEDHEILMNYFKRRKQQLDDSVFDVTTEEEVKDIFKRDKKIVHDTSTDNLQKNIESTIPAKRKSDNLCNSTISIEKCGFYDATTDEENEALIYEHGTPADDSQKNIDIIPVEVKSGNLSDTSECTDKYCSKDDTTIKEERQEETLICTCNISPNNSRKNISVAPDEIKSKNLCDSIASSEKYIHDATADEKIKNGAPTCGTSVNKSQRSIKYAISAEIKSDNCDSNTEKYCVLQDATTEKKIKDKASICILDVSPNNSQKNVENIISVEISDNSHNSTVSITDNSNGSIACIEKNYAIHDVTRDKQIEDKTSVYKCVTVSNNSQKNIKNKVSAKEQYVENSSLIVDKKNGNKNNACTEPSKNILSTIELDLNKNISVENISLNQNIKKKADTYAEAEKVNIQGDLANQKDQEICSVESADSPQCKNMQNYSTSHLKLPIAFESTLCDVDEQDSVLQNVENLLLTNNNAIAKDRKTIDQLSISASTSEANSSKRKDDEFLSIQTNSFRSSSNYYEDNDISDSHSADDDNNGNIEIEIKIKPKLKHRVSRKFSLKASWSAVNTCIKDLHTLKANPSFLNKLFQMDHKTSEKSKHKSTNKSPENNTSLDNNENVTVENETEDYHIISDSSLIAKDNINDSQSQNFQDDPILNENINTMDHNKKEKDGSMQSINAMTIETSPESNKLLCDTSDLGKQLDKAFTDDKQKTNKEQNFPNNTPLERARNMAEHKQEKKNKCVSFIEQKKTQMATGNNLKSVKTTYDTPNVEQRTSSDAIYSKVRVRSIAELSCYTLNSTSFNASAPSRNVCSSFCQSVPRSASPQSTSQSTPSQSASPQSTPQSAPPQSAPPQSALPQSALPQLAPPQSAPLQSAPPQLAPLQSTFPQSASFQSIPSQSAPLQSTLPQSAPFQSVLQPVPFQSTFQSVFQSAFESALESALQSTVRSAPLQSAPPQSAPPQSAPAQSAPPQSAPPQSVPPQSTSLQTVLPQSALPQSASFQLAFLQSAALQSTLPQSVLLQSAPIQSAPPQSAPSQLAPVQSTFPQSAPLQSAPPQLAPVQSTLPQSAPFESASLQSTFSQSVPFQSASPQLALSQSAPPRLAPPRLAPPRLAPPRLTPVQSTLPQSAPFQSAPLQSTLPQSAPPRLAPPRLAPPRLTPVQSTLPQSAPFQSAPLQSTLPQSAPFQSASPQSTPLQSASFQSISPQPITYSQVVPPQLTSRLVSPQLASPQSVSKQSPSCNTADRHTYLSHEANVPIPPVESNTPNIKCNPANFIHSIIKRICSNIEYCRSVIRHKFLRMPFYAVYIQEMCMILKQIDNDIQSLKKWLRMNNESVITYINQYVPLNQSITMMELINYNNIIMKFDMFVKRTLEQNNAKSNTSQYPNIGGSVPNASMPSVNAQPFSKSTPNVRMPNHDKFMQSSTMPRPTPTVPNVNQQQLFGNSLNSPQIPDPRQSTSNIRQQYTGYVPSTGSSGRHIPNVNQQQFLGNANHPVQSQHMPSANMSNIGSQQVFLNTSNVPSSNSNMYSCIGPVNQENVNVSPTINMRQPHVTLKSTSNTATAFAANVQQQKQMYSHSTSSQINSDTVIYPSSTTNQNIAPEICQSVPNIMSKFSMRNPNTPQSNAAVGNVRQKDTNQQKASSSQQVAQASSKRAQYNCYSNPNKRHVFEPQSAHCNLQTCSVQNIQPDQNVQQTLQQKLQQNRRLMQAKDTSVRSTNLTTNNITQNISLNVPDKGAEIPASQNRKRKNASCINSQQNLDQRTSSTCNVSQNTSGLKTCKSQISQTTISTSQKDGAVLNSNLPNFKLAAPQTNKAYNFNLGILTDIQKIVLRNQIFSYFHMLDQRKCPLTEQEFKRTHYERTILIYLFQNLHNYLMNLIKESQIEECIGKDLQDNTSQDRSVLQKNPIQISVNELTNTQSNRDNKNSSTCNRNLEKQSSEQSIDSNISKNLKAQNESSFTHNFTVLKKLLTKDTRVQEQNNDILKKEFRKSSLVVTEKHLENTEVSSLGHSEIPEKNSIAEVSAKNSETEAQDNAKINESLKTLPKSSGTPEENSTTEVSAKNSETEAQGNAKINESLKISSSKPSKISEESSVTEVSAKNSESEAQDNTQMNEFLKAVSSYDKQVPELCSLTRSAMNLQDAKKTEDQPEIAKNNVNEKANDVETRNIHENVATLNNSEENDTIKTSRSSYNMANQNKEVYNANNEIPSENLYTVICDDVSENTEILNSTEIQSDPSRDSVPASSNNIWRSISPKKCESTEMSQIHIAHEECAEAILGCLNTQQEDSTNERSNNSTEEIYTEMSDSPGKLYIDESVEESQEHNEVLSSEEDNWNALQDSTFDMITCDSTEGMPSPLKNMIEVADTSQDFVTESQSETLNEEFFEPKKILQEISFEDEWNMGENMIQPISTIKEAEHTKEEDGEQLLEEEMSTKFKISEDASSMEENEIQPLQSIYLKSPEDMKEMEIDTHNGIKTINDQFKHVSEQNYYEKSQTSCKSVQKDDFVDINTEEVFANNDILNTDIECISVRSDDSEDTTMPSILNTKSISPSLFERMENTDTFLQSDLESLNEKDEQSFNMNDNLEIPDEIDDKLCLRCKRKSTVYCHCLEAHYCSQRCSFLHWKAKHYKQCKGRNSMICTNI